MTILEYLWAIAVILEGNSVYRHLTNQNLHLTLICAVVSVLLLFAQNRFRVRKGTILGVLLLLMYVFVYFAVWHRAVSREIYICTLMVGLPVMVLLFSIYAEQGAPYRLFARMANVILILTILSLIVWLLGSVLGVLSTNSSVRVTWGRDKIINGYFGLQYDAAKDTTYGITLFRNQSIFAEAPMFNLWLCISLAAECFLKEKHSKPRCLVYILGVLSTVSTTGILFLGILFFLLYFEKLSKGKAIGKVILGFLLIILVPAALFLGQTIYTLKASTRSYAIRMQDFVKGFSVFKSNPVFGTGFGSLNSILSTKVNGSILSNVGYSNSIMALLATGGLWLFVLFLLGLIGYLFKKPAKRDIAVRKFGLCYLFLYVTTIFFARYIAFVFFALGLSLFINGRFSTKEPHSL